ncbi:MAG: ABC-2 family transporter protein [Alphaproteobacteria bacterium]|nr:ABC-2 family transporter protein [Alphaproteobacteria bacterium]
MSALSVYVANIRLAIAASFNNRVTFILQSLGMVVNDGFFLVLWFMFFAGFRQIGGWGRDDVALLLAIIMVIVAIAGVLFGGYRDMAATILKGEIDSLLTQPTAVLLRLIARESIPSAWGDLVVGLVLLFTYADIGIARLPLAMFAILCGLTVYVSSAVLYASLAFWFAGARSFARDLTDFMLLFSSYPGSIYTGATKLVAYTILPAGFVVLTPVSLIRQVEVRVALLAAAAALTYFLLALTAFYGGLGRYRRGLVQAGLS